MITYYTTILSVVNAVELLKLLIDDPIIVTGISVYRNIE